MLSPQMRAIIRAAARRNMTDTCTIEREADSVGEFGSRSRVWTIVDSNVPCRLITSKAATQGMSAEYGGQEVMADEYRLCVPYDTVLEVDMRVTVSGAVYNVASIVDGRTDKGDVQAMVIRQRSA